MDKLLALQDWLRHKKTYLLMASAIVAAWAAYANDSMTLQAAVEATFAALGGITLRAGVAKTGEQS